MAFGTPVIKGNRPYLKAALKSNAPTSVAAWTGTKTRTTQVSDTATLIQTAQALAALIDDLRTSGIIL